MAWRMHEGVGWWMLFGWLWFIVFLIVVVWIINKVSNWGNSKGNPSALEIAKQRYARGEITKEQFEQIKKDLS